MQPLAKTVATMEPIVAGYTITRWKLAGAFAVGTIIGIYALVFGVLLIMLALRLRKHASRAASQS